MRRAILGACLTLVLTSGAALAAGAYLSDLLKEPAYRASWTALFAGQAGVPEWITTFSETANGVVTPGSDVAIAGATYQYAPVCQPHDCAGNTLGVLFAPGGGQAWALLDAAGEAPRFFGSPDAAVQTVLKAQLDQ